LDQHVKSNPQSCAVVAIGRNEGERLVACLDALQGQGARVVYVDSGSTDNSVEEARKRGVAVVALDMSIPFTAARARNAGWATLVEGDQTPPEYVQFIDGDCILQPDWLETASKFLAERPKVAIVSGRNRERFPERSVYNWLADIEWDTPVGEGTACGGNAMIRTTALLETDGFNPNLIAGEEPELCLRLRKKGWSIWRIDAEMTLHDAALERFGQWWQRAKRAGFAAAEATKMHGKGPERHGVKPMMRAVIWGGILPLCLILGAAFISPWILLLGLIYPLQIVRRHLKGDPWTQAFFVMLAKIPELQGVLRYIWHNLQRREASLIEHK